MVRRTRVAKGDFPELAAELGESAETAATVHLLERGICDAWTSRSEAGELLGCFIMPEPYPDEPFAFGVAEEIWALAHRISGWGCLNVPEASADGVAARMRRALGSEPRVLGDLYLELTSLDRGPGDGVARLLTSLDLPLLEAAEDGLRGGGFESTEAMLRDGTVAVVVIDGRIVSTANTSVVTNGFEELGVATKEGFRNRGYAEAAARVVLERVFSRSRTAVWSCGEDNRASIRVADKLGFTRTGRRCYVIPPA